MSATTDVMTAHNWRSNAHMLADLRRVMPPPKGRWCDLTYGKGVWWRAPNTPPDDLVRCIGPHTDPVDGAVVIDFRATPFADDKFAATFFDPPYVLKGTDARFAKMNRAYGIDGETMRARGDGTRRENLVALIEDGLTEAARITRPGGWILAKAGRGVDGGPIFSTDDLMVRHGHALGLPEVVSLWLLSTPRSQAHRGPQRTPRSNVSRLTVFEVAG